MLISFCVAALLFTGCGEKEQQPSNGDNPQAPTVLSLADANDGAHRAGLEKEAEISQSAEGTVQDAQTEIQLPEGNRDAVHGNVVVDDDVRHTGQQH